ncbi:MAG: ribonuclease P protein component [Parcubacteria group bacterium]|nr:ribonuclease P protein component [Parcubacteria group bacterium]
MLPKVNRLGRERDFRLVFNSGEALHSPYITLWVKKGEEKVSRAGILLKSGLAKRATERNYWRRRLREIAEKILPSIKEPFDFVIRLKTLPKKASAMETLDRELRLVMKKAKMI